MDKTEILRLIIDIAEQAIVYERNQKYEFRAGEAALIAVYRVTAKMLREYTTRPGVRQENR